MWGRGEKIGVNLTVQDLLRQDPVFVRQYLWKKLSITSLYIISDAPKYDIIWTENSDVIDSFISEIWSTNPGFLHPGAKDPGRVIHTIYHMVASIDILHSYAPAEFIWSRWIEVWSR